MLHLSNVIGVILPITCESRPSFKRSLRSLGQFGEGSQRRRVRDIELNKSMSEKFVVQVDLFDGNH